MTLRIPSLKTILKRISLEEDVMLARVHGRIVGASEDGHDDAMPEWVKLHKSGRVRQAWWTGFVAEAERFVARRDRHHT